MERGGFVSRLGHPERCPGGSGFGSRGSIQAAYVIVVLSYREDIKSSTLPLYV